MIFNHSGEPATGPLQSLLAPLRGAYAGMKGATVSEGDVVRIRTPGDVLTSYEVVAVWQGDHGEASLLDVRIQSDAPPPQFLNSPTRRHISTDSHPTSGSDGQNDHFRALCGYQTDDPMLVDNPVLAKQPLCQLCVNIRDREA